MLSHRPPRKRGSRSARVRPSSAIVSGREDRATAASPAKASVTQADEAEREPDAGVLGQPTEDGAEHRTEDRDAERRSDDLAPTLARRFDRYPRERACPGRGARDALNEACESESDRAVGRREREAGDGEQQERADDLALRAPAGGCEPARDASEEGAGPVRAHEQPGTGLREVELVGIRRDERGQRGEEQRVDEDDRADEGEQAAHALEPSRAQQKMHRAGGALVRLPD